jgi:hypothetical protein
MLVTTLFFIQNNPLRKKYSTVTFAHMDKVGKLDEIKNPEIIMPQCSTIDLDQLETYSTKPSFWYRSLMGTILFKYYKQTNQQF